MTAKHTASGDENHQKKTHQINPKRLGNTESGVPVYKCPPTVFYLTETAASHTVLIDQKKKAERQLLNFTTQFQQQIRPFFNEAVYFPVST